MNNTQKILSKFDKSPLLQKRFDALACAVLIPTYNNSKTLFAVINEVLLYTHNIIVVNDGSTDNTKDILKRFPQVFIEDYPRNRGKGNALQVGFSIAKKLRYKYVISIDSDGQHSAKDFAPFLDDLENNGDALIIGARNMDQGTVPTKSSFGNKFSNFWFWVETGKRMPDTQSGFRLYPLEKLADKHFFTKKFEFEIEVIVRASWSEIPVRAVPVKVFYPEKEDRVSHFRPFRDFTRISILNSFLTILALLWFRPAQILVALKRKGLKALLGSKQSVFVLAVSLGFGAFMGIVPVWGYQMLIAVAIAHLFKLNKVLVLIASNISFPPLIPIILWISVRLGEIFFTEPIRVSFSDEITFEFVKTILLQYLVGSMFFAISAGLVVFSLSYLLIKLKRKKQK